MWGTRSRGTPRTCANVGRRLCNAKSCRLTGVFDRLPDQFCRLLDRLPDQICRWLDRLSDRFALHWAQAVGDALSGVLLVEAALRILGWSLPDWAATYADLPSRQLKVRRL